MSLFTQIFTKKITGQFEQTTKITAFCLKYELSQPYKIDCVVNMNYLINLYKLKNSLCKWTNIH